MAEEDTVRLTLGYFYHERGKKLNFTMLCGELIYPKFLRVNLPTNFHHLTWCFSPIVLLSHVDSFTNDVRCMHRGER
jgi:hypothetical protein